MRRFAVSWALRPLVLAAISLIAGAAVAGQPPKGVAAVPAPCLDYAAEEWSVPADALRLILAVEQGSVGACSSNSNGT